MPERTQSHGAFVSEPMPNHDPQDRAAESPPPPADPHPSLHLPVLPNSGKVEDLRRQAEAARAAPPAAAPLAPGTTAEAPAAVAAPLSAAAKSIRQKLLE